MRAALLALFLLLLSWPASAADQCRTKSEVRKMFPRSHIYWFADGARRCWSNKRERRAQRSRTRPEKPFRGIMIEEAEPLPMVPAPPVAPALPSDAPPPAPPPAPRLEQRPAPMLFENRWDEASAQADGEQLVPVFSTFAPGTEPDVWPPLAPSDVELGQTIGAVLAFALVGLAFWFAAAQSVQLLVMVKQ